MSNSYSIRKVYILFVLELRSSLHMLEQNRLRAGLRDRSL
jgi:hypothetical protein